MTTTRYTVIKNGLEIQSDSHTIQILTGNYDPSSSGETAEIGSLFLQDNGNIWKKTGSTDTSWELIEGSSTSGGFSISRQTSNFTASAGYIYKTDTGLIVTLPSSPSDNDRIYFSPLGDMTSSNTTIDRNGNQIQNKSENLIWDVNNAFGLIYDSTNGSWLFVN